MSKHRFEQEKEASASKNFIISIMVFAAVFFAFLYGVSSLSSRSAEEELHTLETAVTRGITRCYAIEGNYPASLDYLKENYGLTYDEDKYFVGYHPLGANIRPDVTIIKKTAK